MMSCKEIRRNRLWPNRGTVQVFVPRDTTAIPSQDTNRAASEYKSRALSRDQPVRFQSIENPRKMNILSRVMLVTIDGVGLTTGFIGFLVSYAQLHCTHYSRPSHKVTLHSLQWQRLLSLCSTALSRLSLSRSQDLLQTRLSSLTGSHWPSTNSSLLFCSLLFSSLLFSSLLFSSLLFSSLLFSSLLYGRLLSVSSGLTHDD
jgi:hypothetical protein